MLKLLLSLALLMPATVYAQSNVTRIIVAFAAGGPVDSVARIMADQLSKELGRTVIIENKPGANGAIGAAEVKKSPADGATIWLTSVGAAAINSAIYPQLSYDMKRDFAPVSNVVNNVELLVVASNHALQNASDFVTAAKQAANPITMASSGIGSIPHLAIEQLADATGAKFQHIPYRGAAPAINDVMAGHVVGFFGDVAGLIGHVQGGKLKPLGLASKNRHPAIPHVKTLEEQGLGAIDTNNWYAMFVAMETPAPVIEGLNKAIRATLAAPLVKDKLLALGAEPAPSSPKELADLLNADTAKWAALVKAKNIKGE